MVCNSVIPSKLELDVVNIPPIAFSDGAQLPHTFEKIDEVENELPRPVN